MFKNLLVLLLSIFLLLSCSKKDKEVILSEPTDEEKAQSIYAEAVEALKGSYFTAGDVNTFKEDLIECSKISQYVYGINVETSGPTAKGLFYAMKAVLNFISNTKQTDSNTK